MTPTTPKYCAVTNRKKYIISGCKSRNLLNIYGRTKLFSAHCAIIKTSIIQAVEAVTGLATHKIQVFEMN